MKRKPFRQRRPYRHARSRLRLLRLWRRDVESLMRALVERSLTSTPRIASKMPRNSRWGGVTLWSDEPLTEDGDILR